MFLWAADGNTVAEIVRRLYAQRVPTPAEYRAAKGKPIHDTSRSNGVWSSSAVIHILTDERYAGTYVIGKRAVKEIGGTRSRLKDESEWIKIPDHHPAIVSMELYEQANAVRRQFKQPNKQRRDYLLRGKVFCGYCDHAMSRKGKTTWFYCRHAEVSDNLPCHGLQVREKELEQAIFESIKAHMLPVLGLDICKDDLTKAFNRRSRKRNSVPCRIASESSTNDMHSERLTLTLIRQKRKSTILPWWAKKTPMP